MLLSYLKGSSLIVKLFRALPRHTTQNSLQFNLVFLFVFCDNKRHVFPLRYKSDVILFLCLCGFVFLVCLALFSCSFCICLSLSGRQSRGDAQLDQGRLRSHCGPARTWEVGCNSTYFGKQYSTKYAQIWLWSEEEIRENNFKKLQHCLIFIINVIA